LVILGEHVPDLDADPDAHTGEPGGIHTNADARD